MKKFTYIGVALLATVLALSGCRRGKTSSTTSGSNPTTSITTSSTSGSSTTSGSSGSSSTPVEPSVTSVSVSPKTATLGINETKTLKATVKVQGGADNSVTWKSSDSSVCSVTSSGVVKGLKVGTATITCTSKFDSSKKDTATITVMNKGFLPELIDQGFTYYEKWEEAISNVKKFLNVSPFVSQPVDVSKGAYLLCGEATEDSVAYCQVIIDGDQFDSYLTKLAADGYHIWTEMFWGIFEVTCSIDSTKSIEIDPDYYYDDSYENVLGTQLTFYRAEDLFYNDQLTTHTEWSSDDLAEFAKVDGMEAIPFVKLGEHYEVQAYDYEVEGVYDTIFIQDYSLAINALDNYGATLVGAGYEFDIQTDLYIKPVAGSASVGLYVSFTWGSSGNYIEVGFMSIPLTEFPSDLLNEFTSSKLDSKYEVPAPVGANANEFTYSEGQSSEFGDTAIISGYSYTYNEFLAYKAQLENDNWTITEFIPQDDYNYGQVMIEKGRIGMYFYYENDYDEEAEEYSDDFGTLYMYVYQADGFEDPGIYFAEKNMKVGIDETKEIKYTLYEIEGTVTFTSNDPSIAVVSSDGFVTGISEGNTVITGSVTYEGFLYEATLIVSVSETQYFTKVESSLTDYSGTYLIVCEETGYAFNGALEKLDAAFNGFQVVIDNKQIEATDDLIAAAFTFESNGSGTYSIQTSTENYIGSKDTGNKLQTSTNSGDFKNTVSVNNGIATIKSDGGTVLKFNTGSDQLRFRFYKTTSGGTSDISLYKLD